MVASANVTATNSVRVVVTNPTSAAIAYDGANETLGLSGAVKSPSLSNTSGASATAGVAYGASTYYGTGTPEGVVTAAVGAMYLRSDGGAGTTLYIKESGTGNTGWAGK